MKSKYRGVFWDKTKWKVQIRDNGKCRYLGRFECEEEAARAYDAVACELQSRPQLNFPTEPIDKTRIPLGKGKYALIDEELYEYLSQWQWWVNASGYAIRREERSGVRTTFYMHREVVGSIPDGLQVDHVSGNRLDNRRNNLRVVTASENRRNSGRRSDNSIGLKCVWWENGRGKWTPQIQSNGKKYFLGRFDNPIEAAFAYDKAAAEHFGEFARPNFDREETPDGIILRPNAADILQFLTRR